MRSTTARRATRASSIHPSETAFRSRAISATTAGAFAHWRRQFAIVLRWTPCFAAARLSPNTSASRSARATCSVVGSFEFQVRRGGFALADTRHAACAEGDSASITSAGSIPRERQYAVSGTAQGRRPTPARGRRTTGLPGCVAHRERRARAVRSGEPVRRAMSSAVSIIVSAASSCAGRTCDAVAGVEPAELTHGRCWKSTPSWIIVSLRTPHGDPCGSRAPTTGTPGSAARRRRSRGAPRESPAPHAARAPRS